MPIPSKAIDKISDYVQGRSERRRNSIASLKREQDAIKRKKHKKPSDIGRLKRIADELSKLYESGINQA